MAVDIEGFLDRTGMKGVELQKKLDLSSGTLSIYKSGKSNPSYSILCRLIEEGMTAREMFGDDLAAIPLQYAISNNSSLFIFFSPSLIFSIYIFKLDFFLIP